MSINQLNDVEKSQVQTLRALMALHGFTVSDLSTRTFIPQENIEAFLSGVTASLSDPSFIEVFRALGLDDEGNLIKSRVHFWHIKLKRSRNKENLMPLASILKMIGEHSSMALTKQKNVTPVLIKAGSNRVVLFVHGPQFMTVNVADLGLNPGSFAGNQTVRQVPKYYYDLLKMCALRPNYFDLVLDGTYINEDINLLRMVALEHDVTISELVNYVIRNDKRALQESEIEYKDSSVVSLHQQTSSAAEVTPSTKSELVSKVG